MYDYAVLGRLAIACPPWTRVSGQKSACNFMVLGHRLQGECHHRLSSLWTLMSQLGSQEQVLYFRADQEGMLSQVSPPCHTEHRTAFPN